MNELEMQKLVWKAIKNFPYYPYKEDLFQVGYVGILKAAQNYREDAGTKFSSYAYFYILGEMKKLTREDKAMKVSRDITKLNLKIEKATILLTQKLHRTPTTIEVADTLGISEWMVIEAMNSRITVRSMEEPINRDGKEMSYHEIIPDRQEDIEQLLDLRNEVCKLPEKEQKIIYERYYKDRTQTELAKELNTSQVQVSRMENKILQKLNQRLTIPTS